MKTKKCSKCKEPKKLSEFSKDKNKKDGFQLWCKECGKQYREEHKVEIKKWFEDNKEELIEYRKQYNEAHKEKIKNYSKQNRRKISEYGKIWYKENKEKVRKRQGKYERRRYHSDIEYKITKNLQSRIRSALKGTTKSLSTMFLIGCEIDYLMYHIQKQFTKDMTWDNHGEWEIDHINPCAKFDLIKPEEQEKCFHYTNLQPLWAEDNRIKSDKYSEELK